MDARRVIEEALRLPVDVRAALAGELLESLDGGAADPGYEEAWSAEIKRRLDALESGEMATISVEEFLARLDGSLSGRPST